MVFNATMESRQKEANTMTTTTTEFTIENAEDALVSVVAEATGQVPAVRETDVTVSDDRGTVQGWAVLVGDHFDSYTYEVIPPEGDCCSAWLGDDLARLLTDDQVADLIPWLTA